MDDTYTTPEGFTLYRPLVFPDVLDLAEIVTVERAWDFTTMNHYNGYPQAETPKHIGRGGFETNQIGYHHPDGGSDRTISRFMSTGRFAGRPNYQVLPTERLVHEVYREDTTFVFFDSVNLEAILHEERNRVLLVAGASGLLASRWLAYLDPDTFPTAEQLNGVTNH